jgi:hypothetical protein
LIGGLEVTFPLHDPSDAGSNPAEVVEFLRTEKFREQKGARIRYHCSLVDGASIALYLP